MPQYNLVHLSDVIYSDIISFLLRLHHGIAVSTADMHQKIVKNNLFKASNHDIWLQDKQKTC